MLTRETDYAIRALLCLASRGEDAVVSTTVLSEEMDIPYRFLRRILLRLVARGLVASVRGKQGGLRLTHTPAQVSLLDIALAVDPDAVALNRCLVEPDSCRRVSYCAVHKELNRVQALVNGELAAVSLATLVARSRAER